MISKWGFLGLQLKNFTGAKLVAQERNQICKDPNGSLFILFFINQYNNFVNN